MPSPRATRSSCGASAASVSGTATRARGVIPRRAAASTFPRSGFPSSRSASGCASSSTREAAQHLRVKRLWAPWRMQYVSGAQTPTGCIFCMAPAAGDDRAQLVLHRGAHGYLILNAYPYASGHLLAVVYRHIATLAEASRDRAADLMNLV